MCFSIDGPRDYKHEDIGFNYRMSNLIAAVGLAQVEKADHYRALRIHNGRLYRRYLKDVPGISFQTDSPDVVNVYWMNAILLDPKVYGHTRDELIAHLKKNGIDTRLLFTGLNKQPSLKKYGCDVSEKYPVTDNLTKNGLYLPSASNLTKEQIEYVCNVIEDFKS
jgi:perosamine synthetase